MDHRAPMQILVVRHGQSRWNAMRRWQGLADTPLTTLGRLQARRAAQAMAVHPRLTGPLAERAVSAVWASTLSRASQTAALIADELRIDDVRCDRRLAEVDAGPWQGLTRTEIEAGWPGYLAERRRPAGFEPTETVIARTTDGLRAVASETLRRGDAMAVAVMHSGLLRTLLHHTGVEVDGVPNLSGWFVTIDGDMISVVDTFVPDGGDTASSLRSHTVRRESGAPPSEAPTRPWPASARG